MPCAKNNNGEFVYIGLASQLIRQLQIYENIIQNKTITLLFNIDGIPIFKSSAMQFWPILGMVTVPNYRLSPFVIAIFCGKSKPVSVNTFCKEFVNELNNLILSGLSYNGTLYTVKFDGLVCDAPARAFLKSIKGHTGFHGCERCTEKGQYLSHRVAFVSLDEKRRTHESFINKEDLNHHTGTSILEEIININMIYDFPLDYMHMACLGVMRRMLNLWIKGSKKFCLVH